MTIETYILQLLNNNKIVVIPEFGGFTLKYIPAKFIEQSHNMEPPHHEAEFDKKLSYQDNTLLNLIVISENIAQEKAKALIEEFILDVQEKLLEINRKYYIKDLGCFYQNNNKEIIFESKLKSDSPLDTFGLSSYDLEPVHPEKTKIINAKTEKKITISNESNNIIKWIVITTSVCVFGILIILTQLTNITPSLKIDFSFLDMEYNNPYLDSNEFAGLLDTMNFDDFDSDFDSDIDTTSQIEKSIDNMTEMQNALKLTNNDNSSFSNETVIKTEISDSLFYIIAGSFATYKNADFLKRKLINQGYKDSEILHSDNRFRISIYKFTKKQSALIKLYSVRKIQGRQNCWLLKQKI